MNVSVVRQGSAAVCGSDKNEPKYYAITQLFFYQPIQELRRDNEVGKFYNLNM